MSKSVVLMAMTLTALAFVATEVLAYPISGTEAQKCGHWQAGANGALTCAGCEFGPRRKSVCHWIACDSTGCEQVDIAERKMPPRRPRQMKT
jgi:hypothetical protein